MSEAADEQDEEEEGSRVSELRQQIARLEVCLLDQVRQRKAVESKAAAAQSNLEAEQRELRKIKQKIEAAELKSRALQGEDVRFREKHLEPSFELAAGRIPVLDALQITANKLDQIKSMSASAELSLQRNELMFILVQFNADETRFGLCAQTTFAALLEECARHWRLSSEETCELKSLDTNKSFAPELLVSATLPIITTGSKSVGIRLHVVIKSDATFLANKQQVKFAPEFATNETSKQSRLYSLTSVAPPAAAATPTLPNLPQPDSQQGGATSPPPPPPPRLPMIRKLQKLAWEQDARQDSLVFNGVDGTLTTVQQHLGNTPFNLSSNSTGTFADGVITSPDSLTNWANQVALPYLNSSSFNQVLVGAQVLFLINSCQDNADCPLGSTMYEFNLLHTNLGSVSQILCTAEINLVAFTKIRVDVLPLSVFASRFQTSMQPLVIVSDVLVTRFACGLLFRTVRQPMYSIWTLLIAALWICVVVQLCLGIDFEVSAAPSVQLVPYNGSTTLQDLSPQLARFHAYLSMSCASLFLLLLLMGKIDAVEPSPTSHTAL
ncbi:hypothetical protein BASA81_003468 [Batrachochytrium salamandrivorans]|nr:hypothetical protein BASA81_003468 [Batrachochytrium salamandrivorans]